MSVGVNVAESVWLLPAPRMVPEAGVYVNCPGHAGRRVELSSAQAVP